jgi:hypothetical protein
MQGERTQLENTIRSQRDKLAREPFVNAHAEHRDKVVHVAILKRAIEVKHHILLCASYLLLFAGLGEIYESTRLCHYGVSQREDG